MGRSLSIMCLLTTLLLSAGFFVPADARAADAPTSRPANLDAATWERMLEIDGRAGKVSDLSADFEQKKFTAMLKKPLASRGRVFVRGSAMLWETREPEASSLQITDREVRIFYPAEKTVEVYSIEQKMGQLAASPLPRLAVLTEHFTIEPMAQSEIAETAEEKTAADDPHRFAARLTPTDPAMREHVDQVRVLLDVDQGLILRLEMRDPDGDRTVISFSKPVINAGLNESDVQAKLPPDVTVTRPLAAVEGGAAKDQPK